MKKNKLFILIFAVLSLLAFTTALLIKEHSAKLQVTENYLSEHSIFEDIYFSFQGDPLQKINLYKGEDFDSFHAYIPANPDKLLRVYFTHCKTILFNGKELSNGDLLPTVNSNTPYHVQAINWEHEVIEEDYITFYFSGTLPAIYISTESGTMEHINSNEELKEAASYAVYTKEGNLNSTGQCSIKGRGNTSWSDEQKPYNVNLADGVSILGMNTTSDWALLSNYGDDLPQLKNKIVFELAEQLNLPFTPQSEFVHLYLNGQYNGLYLLTQRVKVNDGTVKLADLDLANQKGNASNNHPEVFEVTTVDGFEEGGVLYANNLSDISGGYLLEFDARYKDEISYFTTAHQKVAIKSPSAASKQQVTYIADYVREAEAAIFSDNGINSSTEKSYLDYIDIDSWAKIYALQNYFVQWDVEFSSFYLYKPKNDSLLYAGPVWDFDLSCGKMYLGDYPRLSQHLLWLEDTQSTWLQRLSKHDYFLDYTTQQYLDKLSPAISQLLTHEFSDIVTPLTSAVEMDAVRWDKGDVSLNEEADNLYYWLSERQKFLDDYYQNPNTYYKVTFEFAWGNVTYYVKKNTALGFLPYREYGEKEKYATLYGFEEILGWMDESGNEVYAEDIITEDMIYYPIYQLSAD